MQVQKLRLIRGWSQQQLAEFSGLSVRTIQRIEAGDTASVESLKALAAVFEVDFTTLNPESTDMTTAPTAATPALSILESEERAAFRYVRKVRGFYKHALIYVLVIAGLWLIDALGSPNIWWAWRPTLGWGLGLLVHGILVFGAGNWFGPGWERRMAEKRLGRPLS